MEYNALELLKAPTPDKDFNDELERLQLEAICGRPYIRVGKLQQWLRGKNQDAGISEFHRLLKRVHSDRNDWFGFHPLLTQEQNAQGRSDRLDLVFSILYILGEPKLLYPFRQSDIIDSNLPVSLSSLNHKLVNEMKLPNGVEIAKKFDCLQWSFIPKIFDIRDNRVGKQWIIPIHERRDLKLDGNGLPIQRGVTSNIFIVEILEEFLSPKVKSCIPFSCYCPTKDALGPRYQLVLKSFVNGSDSFYDNEVKNLSTLGQADTKGVVRYLGSFRHAGWPAHEQEDPGDRAVSPTEIDSDTTSCHILFEYGECDLLDLFEQTLPSQHAEIRLFWLDLFGVANALEELHHLKIEVDGTSEQASGIHGDIKPENIILVQKQLKLADLGFSRVMHKVDGQPTSAVIDGITKPYAAPECIQGGAPLPQSIDIWSLGCVFSLAATWIVRGYDGYEHFAGLRKYAVEGVIKRQKESGQKTHLIPGSFFHDGVNVLPEVIDWHRWLRSSLRIGDEITSQVLELVETEMLISDPSKRIPAKSLVLKLKALAGQDVDPFAETPLRIQRYFDQLKKDVSIKAQDSEGLQNDVTEAVSESSKRLKIENHRLEYLTTISRVSEPAGPPSPLTPQIEMPSSGATVPSPSATRPEMILSEQPHDSPPPDMEYSPVTREDVSASYALHMQAQTHYTHSAADTTMRNRRKRQTARPENAWQARGRIRAMKEEKSTFNRLISKANLDDRLLEHYKDRDIIFLIDNQGSMSEFWFEARWIFKTLLKISRKIDTNGVDLYFTCSNFTLLGEKNESILLGALDRPEVIPKPGDPVNMSEILDRFFKFYLENVDKQNKYLQEELLRKPSHRRSMSMLGTPKTKKAEVMVRDATLIVLTDGVWPTCRRGEFDETFKTFTEGMNSRGRVINPSVRSYSVEFIRFGENPKAMELLEHLDDDLKFSGIEDIVDTEEARGGDVYKMMLGSFVPYYDRLDGPVQDDQPNSGSPLQQQQVRPPLLNSSPPQQTAQHIRQNSLSPPARPTAVPRYTVPPVREPLLSQGVYSNVRVSSHQDPPIQFNGEAPRYPVIREAPTFQTMASLEMTAEPQDQQWREAAAARELHRRGYTGPYPR